MRRRAVAVGSEVPAGDFAFRVHSVFRSAMNLEVAGRRGLVTLVPADAGDFPQAVRLATRERFDEWPAVRGTPGARTGDTLTFRTGEGGDAFTVDLAGAEVASRREPPRVDPAAAGVRAVWAECAFHLDGLQAEKDADLRLAALVGMAPPASTLGERFTSAVRELSVAIRERDADHADRVSARILGLGAGLTPSGDDFLCGLLAALWCTSREHDDGRRFVTGWGAWLSHRLGATNAISATFLECAIAGCFPGVVTALACAFEAGPAGPAHPGPRAALDALCALGSHSGMDTATGFLFGLWLRTDEETRRYAPQL